MSAESTLSPSSRLQDHRSWAFRVGGVAGVLGLGIGWGIGLYRRPSHPKIYALTIGIQSFVVGTSYLIVRSQLSESLWFRSWALHESFRPGLNDAGDGEIFRRQKGDEIRLSTASGAFSGSLSGILARGLRGSASGLAIGAISANIGQRIYGGISQRRAQSQMSKTKMLASANREQGSSSDDITDPHSQAVASKPESWTDFIARQRWTMLTKISDEEYVASLEEQLLEVDAKLAILDEKISAFKLKDSNETSE